MIPDKILKFLDTTAVAIAGTRDKNLVPRLHRAAAWTMETDGETFVCAIPENYTSRLASNLEENRQFAVTVCELVSHETYQFKGDFIDMRAITPDDVALFENCRKRFVKGVTTLFPSVPVNVAGAYINAPSVIVRFKVDEIFVQTPGPGAGTRIFPPEGK